MPGWDANRRTTERCPPKAASCKARWPSSVLTGKFFWRLNGPSSPGKNGVDLFIFPGILGKNAGLGYSEVMNMEKGWERGNFSTCLRKCQVMTWPRTSSQPSIAKVIASGTLKSNSVAAKWPWRLAKCNGVFPKKPQLFSGEKSKNDHQTRVKSEFTTPQPKEGRTKIRRCWLCLCASISS